MKAVGLYCVNSLWPKLILFSSLFVKLHVVIMEEHVSHIIISLQPGKGWSSYWVLQWIPRPDQGRRSYHNTPVTQAKALGLAVLPFFLVIPASLLIFWDTTNSSRNKGIFLLKNSALLHGQHTKDGAGTESKYFTLVALNCKWRWFAVVCIIFCHSPAGQSSLT